MQMKCVDMATLSEEKKKGEKALRLSPLCFLPLSATFSNCYILIILAICCSLSLSLVSFLPTLRRLCVAQSSR